MQSLLPPAARMKEHAFKEKQTLNCNHFNSQLLSDGALTLLDIKCSLWKLETTTKHFLTHTSFIVETDITKCHVVVITLTRKDKVSFMELDRV